MTEDVDWDDAQEFVAWLSKTTGKPLSAAERGLSGEYAAQEGGSTTFAYWWGKDVGAGRAQCAGMREGARTPGLRPLARSGPTPSGLYDTTQGTRAEWVEDCWNLTYRGAPNDRGSKSLDEKATAFCFAFSGEGRSRTRRPPYARRRAFVTIRTFGTTLTAFRVARDLD